MRCFGRAALQQPLAAGSVAVTQSAETSPCFNGGHLPGSSCSCEGYLVFVGLFRVVYRTVVPRGYSCCLWL